MNNAFIILCLLPFILFASPEDSLQSKHNQKLLESVQRILQSSSAVITNQDRVSLGYGCLVTSDGYILTKASLVEEEPLLLIRLNKAEYPAELIKSSLEWDVALLKIDISDGIPLQLSDSSPPLGQVVCANGVTSLLTRRLKLGVIAANLRQIPIQEARLDFQAYHKKDQGYLITELKPNGEAEKAGLKKNDLIHAINGIPQKASDKAFHSNFTGKWPKEEVTLSITRGDSELEFTLPLLWLHEVNSSPQDRNEAMSGRISTRRTGFPIIIQHDIPLSARTVGGPLLSLDGKCIGMNIARFSRSETYAIPAKEMKKLIERWLLE